MKYFDMETAMENDVISIARKNHMPIQTCHIRSEKAISEDEKIEILDREYREKLFIQWLEELELEEQEFENECMQYGPGGHMSYEPRLYEEEDNNEEE